MAILWERIRQYFQRQASTSWKCPPCSQITIHSLSLSHSCPVPTSSLAQIDRHHSTLTISALIRRILLRDTSHCWWCARVAAYTLLIQLGGRDAPIPPVSIAIIFLARIDVSQPDNPTCATLLDEHRRRTHSANYSARQDNPSSR